MSRTNNQAIASAGLPAFEVARPGHRRSPDEFDAGSFESTADRRGGQKYFKPGTQETAYVPARQALANAGLRRSKND
jgi:hypothetical protein